MVEKDGLIGHQNIKEFLGKSLESDRIHHAYLFLGPKGVGKMRLARIFAQSLFCPQAKGLTFCGQCPSCRAFQQGNHSDFTMIQKDGESIKIEVARGLINELSRSSLLSKRRIGIIDGAENLTDDAQNAMLKTLEEPSREKIIILIAERPLLPTINSRVQRLVFRLVKDNLIIDALEKEGASHGQALELANLSLGRPGVALDLFRNKEKKDKMKEIAQFFLSLFNFKDNFNTFAFDILGKDLTKARERFNEISEIGLRLLRDFLFLKIQLPGHTSYFSREAPSDLLAKLSLRQLRFLIEELKNLRLQIKSNIDPRLALENFYLLIH